MIKTKNLGEFQVRLVSAGVQTAAVEKAMYIVPFACQLKAIYAKLSVAGVTGSQINDINKNQTTIFGNATKVSFATGVQGATYGTFSVDPTIFAKGDIISMDVDSIHSGTAAKSSEVILTLQRLRGTGSGAAVQTDTIGLDAE